VAICTVGVRGSREWAVHENVLTKMVHVYW
jgi:hypothetical protein